MTNSGMDTIPWMRVMLACVTVAGLLALMGFVLKYIKMRGFVMPRSLAQGRRLQIVESLALDPRRRLVLVKRDEAEHLLLLGVTNEVVVESDCGKNASSPRIKSVSK